MPIPGTGNLERLKQCILENHPQPGTEGVNTSFLDTCLVHLLLPCFKVNSREHEIKYLSKLVDGAGDVQVSSAMKFKPARLQLLEASFLC